MNRTEKQQIVARHLGRIGWGALLVWIGFCWLNPIELGPALIGIGGITLLVQGARALYGVPVEGFWVAVGVCFGIGGAAHLLGTETPLLPVLLLVVGALLLFGGLIGQLRHHQHRHR